MSGDGNTINSSVEYIWSVLMEKHVVDTRELKHRHASYKSERYYNLSSKLYIAGKRWNPQ